MAQGNSQSNEPTRSIVKSNHFSEKSIADVKKSDIIMYKDRVTQVTEIIGSRLRGNYVKFRLTVEDISTGEVFEDRFWRGYTVEIPNMTKKDYILVSIDNDGYVTMLDEETCETRSDLKIRKNSDLANELLDEYNKNSTNQITITVMEVLNYEKIIAFRLVTAD